MASRKERRRPGSPVLRDSLTRDTAYGLPKAGPQRFRMGCEVLLLRRKGEHPKTRSHDPKALAAQIKCWWKEFRPRRAHGDDGRCCRAQCCQLRGEIREEGQGKAHLLTVAAAVVETVQAPPAVVFLQALQCQMPTAVRLTESCLFKRA